MQDEQPQTEQAAAPQPQPKKQAQQQNPPDWAAFRKAFATLENKVTHIDQAVKALDSKVHLLACTVQENAKGHDELLTELAKSVHDHTKSRGSDTEASVKALAEQTAAIQQTLEATQHLLRCIAADPRALPQLRRAAGQIDAAQPRAGGIPAGVAGLVMAVVIFGIVLVLYFGLR